MTAAEPVEGPETPEPSPELRSEGLDEPPEGDDSGEIAADDASLDTYTTGQAARLLGLSDRRVRQLIAEGRLSGEADAAGVLHLPQQAVHEERARRRKTAPQADPEPGGSAGRQRPASPTEAEVIAAAVAAAVGQVLAGQRELTAQASSLVEAERARFEAERARRMAVEEELLDLRRRLAEAPAPARRRWWAR